MVSTPPKSRPRISSLQDEPGFPLVVVFWGLVLVAVLGLIFYAYTKITSSGVVVAGGRIAEDVGGRFTSDRLGGSMGVGGSQDSLGVSQPFSLNGAVYIGEASNPIEAPRVEILGVPSVEGGFAIWGGVGRDARGHIWLGVCTRSHGSARLLEYIPEEGEFIDHGGVIDALKKSGLYREGASQIKIHSRIVQGADGHLYFSSMDEEGEDAGLGTPPVWGSHLWRFRIKEDRWEHLAAVPEGLIAVSCAGRYVYALGYFGHVLYQYDTHTGSFKSVRVGSVGGHISRNVISDARDHVYVPRLSPGPSGGAPVAALVEYDPQLNEIAQTPLGYYLDKQDPENSHGITAFQPMGDGSIVFSTHTGMLYRIIGPLGGSDAPADVIELRHFHPDGERYIASMFTYTGRRYVAGVAKTPEGRFEWLTYDLRTGVSTAVPLALRYPDDRMIWKHLLYGSITRDRAGNFYVVGTDQNIGKPVLLKLIRSDS